MKVFLKTSLVIFLQTIIFVCNVSGQNPIIQTKFTADPAPMVYKDTVFLYTGHDEDDAKDFKMQDWLLYTSTDMVNWTDRGSVASLKNFSWAENHGAWAAQCIERNGKFYLYCSIPSKGIGVLVSDSPYGPFTDPIDKPLIITLQGWGDIDPTVLIDDDGQAYLYWGNPNLFYVKLNEDMISFSGEIIKEPTKPANYQEGPWIYKRKGHYYMAYASSCCPEGMGYAMSDSPTGPWTYKGMIMDPNGTSFGNHPGIIDYKGNTYVFGFNYALLWAKVFTKHERRSVCLEKMNFNEDGTIQKLPHWSTQGTKQIKTLNLYKRTEAETISWSEGLKTQRDSKTGMYVTEINNNDYLIVKGVDFGKGANAIDVSCTSLVGGKIEIRLDNQYGNIVGVCEINNSGSTWKTFSAKIMNTKGVHDLCFVFKGEDGDLFNIDWWKFR